MLPSDREDLQAGSWLKELCDIDHTGVTEQMNSALFNYSGLADLGGKWNSKLSWWLSTDWFMGSDSTAQKSSIPLTVGVKTRRTGRGGESYKKKVVEGSQKKREGEEFTN